MWTYTGHVSSAEARRSRVALFSQHFHPEENATATLLTSLGGGLIENGIEVTAFCAQPCYFDRSRVARKEVVGGMQIVRLASAGRVRGSLPGRALNMMTFLASAMRAALCIGDADVVVTVTNPPLLPIVGAVRKRLRGNPFVLIVHDVYPDVAVALGVLKAGSLSHWLARRLDRFILNQADVVVALGRDMRQLLAGKLDPSARTKLRVINNWADERQLTPIPKRCSQMARRLGLLNQFVLQYSGNVGRSQGVDLLLRTAQLLVGQSVVILVVGEGPLHRLLRQKAELLSLPNLRFLSRVPAEAYADSLAASDAGLVMLRPGLQGMSVPSKLYSLLAAGRPVVAAMPKEAEVAITVAESGCGLVVANHPFAIAAAAQELARSPGQVAAMGLAARRAFDLRFTRTGAVAEYVRVIRSVTGGRRRAHIP